jgi:glycosyltransferase involved in cell wall biosynthesis
LKHFKYNSQAFGGTEYMGRGFQKYIVKDMPKLDNYLCLIAPGDTPSFEEIYASEKPIIFWMHNTSYQFGDSEKRFLSDYRFTSKLKYLIVISEFQKKETINETAIPEEKIYVIPNAIEPLTYYPNKFKNVEKVKLIHTSSPDRGFDILINSLPLIKEDFSLEIYNRFNPDEFPDVKFDPRVRFYGFTPKAIVREAYELGHIHAYPSTYPETFCISQAEAMSAGMLCLTSDLGALPEVSNGLTEMYSLPKDPQEHVVLFADLLTKAINKVKSANFDPTAQIEYVNKAYSWDAIKDKWLEFQKLL